MNPTQTETEKEEKVAKTSVIRKRKYNEVAAVNPPLPFTTTTTTTTTTHQEKNENPENVRNHKISGHQGSTSMNHNAAGMMTTAKTTTADVTHTIIPTVILLSHVIPYVQRNTFIELALTKQELHQELNTNGYLPPWPPSGGGRGGDVKNKMKEKVEDSNRCVLTIPFPQEIYSIAMTSLTTIATTTTPARDDFNFNPHHYHRSDTTADTNFNTPTTMGTTDDVMFCSMTMAVACGNNFLYVWNPSLGPFPTHSVALGGHTRPVVGVAFSISQQPMIHPRSRRRRPPPRHGHCSVTDTVTSVIDTTTTTADNHDNETINDDFLGAVLASCSVDQSIRLWNMVHDDVNVNHPSYHLRHVLWGHEGSVNCLAFAPPSSMRTAPSTGTTGARSKSGGSTILVSGSMDRTVRLWDIVHGTCLRVLSGHVRTIMSVTVFPLIANIVFPFTGRLSTCTERSTIIPTNGLPSLIASGSVDGTVRLWDLSNTPSVLEHHHQQPSNNDNTNRTNDDNGSGNADDDVDVDADVDPNNDGLVCAFNGNDLNTAWVRSVAVSPNGEYMASGKDDHQIRLYETSSTGIRDVVVQDQSPQVPQQNHRQRGYQLLRNGHKDVVMSVKFSPNSQFLVSGSRDGTVKLWNVPNGNCIATLHVGPQSMARRIERSVVNGGVVSAGTPATGQGRSSPNDDNQDEAPSDNNHEHDDDDENENDVNERNGDNDNTSHQALPPRPIFAVAFAPNGRFVVSGGADCTLRIWNIS